MDLASVFFNTSEVSKIDNYAIIGTDTVILEDVSPYVVIFGTLGKVENIYFSSSKLQFWKVHNDGIGISESIRANTDCIREIGLLFQKIS